MDMSAYSTCIRARMAERGVTQAELARALGVPQSEISRRLLNKVNWQVKDLAAVAELFGVPLHVLIREAEEAVPEQIGA